MSLYSALCQSSPSGQDDNTTQVASIIINFVTISELIVELSCKQNSTAITLSDSIIVYVL